MQYKNAHQIQVLATEYYPVDKSVYAYTEMTFAKLDENYNVVGTESMHEYRVYDMAYDFKTENMFVSYDSPYGTGGLGTVNMTDISITQYNRNLIHNETKIRHLQYSQKRKYNYPSYTKTALINKNREHTYCHAFLINVDLNLLWTNNIKYTLIINRNTNIYFREFYYSLLYMLCIFEWFYFLIHLMY